MLSIYAKAILNATRLHQPATIPAPHSEAKPKLIALPPEGHPLSKHAPRSAQKDTSRVLTHLASGQSCPQT